LDILVASPLTNPEGRVVGLLVGSVPNSHTSIRTILRRNGQEHGNVQLVDEVSKRVIASTDEKRELATFEPGDPMKVLLVSEHVVPTP
jgi:hypothetical protein